MTRRRNNLDWDQRYILRDLRREWPVQRPLPLVLAWYWRYEVITLATLGVVGWSLVSLVGALPAVMIGLIAGAASGLVPATREVIVRGFWHVVTPHRVRRGLVEAGVYSRKGRVPEILQVRSVGAGELVTLWCFAGTSFTDIINGLEVIGTACWAQELQAVREASLHRVRLLVVRRPEAALPPGDWPDTRVEPPSLGSDEIYRPETRTRADDRAGAAGVTVPPEQAPTSDRRRVQPSLGGGEDDT